MPGATDDACAVPVGDDDDDDDGSSGPAPAAEGPLPESLRAPFLALALGDLRALVGRLSATPSVLVKRTKAPRVVLGEIAVLVTLAGGYVTLFSDDEDPCPRRDDAPTQLHKGETLASGKSLQDSSGEYALLMRTSGSLTLCDIEADAVEWSSATADHPGAYAVLQSDGNFVIRSQEDDEIVWETMTDETGAETLAVQPGRVALEGREGRPLWVSNGVAPVTEADHPPASLDELRVWEVLRTGDALVSRGGQYSLQLQADGNLVYSGRGQVLWETDTHDYPRAALAMQHDGNLVLYADPLKPTRRAPLVLFSSGTDNQVVEALSLADDGELVLRGPDAAVVKRLWPPG